MFVAFLQGYLTFSAVVLIWVFVFHGPHFFGTLSRTYADREQFGRRRKLFTQSLVLYPTGPAMIGLGLLLEAGTGRKELHQLFFFLAAMWAFHHVNKQHFGFLALYRAKHKEFNKRDFVFHKYYLLTSLWMPALIMLGTNNQWLVDVPFMLNYATGTQGGMANIANGQVFLRDGCTFVFWTAQAAYGGSLIYRIATGKGINLPLLLLILCCVPLTWFVIQLSMTSGQPYAAFVLVPILTMYHNIQYHGLIWHYNRTKYKARYNKPIDRKRLGLATLISRNFLVYYACGALFTVTTIGWEQYGLTVMNVSGPMNKLSQAFFWGFAFHHYYLDSKIWRASEDAELRSILGFPGKKKKVAPAKPERTDRVAMAANGVSAEPIAVPSARSVAPVANVHREATG